MLDCMYPPVLCIAERKDRNSSRSSTTLSQDLLEEREKKAFFLAR